MLALCLADTKEAINIIVKLVLQRLIKAVCPRAINYAGKSFILLCGELGEGQTSQLRLQHFNILTDS